MKMMSPVRSHFKWDSPCRSWFSRLKQINWFRTTMIISSRSWLSSRVSRSISITTGYVWLLWFVYEWFFSAVANSSLQTIGRLHQQVLDEDFPGERLQRYQSRVCLDSEQFFRQCTDPPKARGWSISISNCGSKNESRFIQCSTYKETGSPDSAAVGFGGSNESCTAFSKVETHGWYYK